MFVTGLWTYHNDFESGITCLDTNPHIGTAPQWSYTRNSLWCSSVPYKHRHRHRRRLLVGIIWIQLKTGQIENSSIIIIFLKQSQWEASIGVGQIVTFLFECGECSHLSSETFLTVLEKLLLSLHSPSIYSRTSTSQNLVVFVGCFPSWPKWIWLLLKCGGCVVSSHGQLTSSRGCGVFSSHKHTSDFDFFFGSNLWLVTSGLGSSVEETGFVPSEETSGLIPSDIQSGRRLRFLFIPWQEDIRFSSFVSSVEASGFIPLVVTSAFVSLVETSGFSWYTKVWQNTSNPKISVYAIIVCIHYRICLSLRTMFTEYVSLPESYCFVSYLLYYDDNDKIQAIAGGQ